MPGVRNISHTELLAQGIFEKEQGRILTDEERQ
jgi:hypothetical protein